MSIRVANVWVACVGTVPPSVVSGERTQAQPIPDPERGGRRNGLLASQFSSARRGRAVTGAVAVPAGLLRREAEEDGGDADDDERDPEVRALVGEAEEPRGQGQHGAGDDVDQIVH